jgi:hypothetical protein
LKTPVRAPLARPDRSFYSSTPAFGRFGIRWFTPQLMSTTQSHGHVEFNWLTNGTLSYLFDGQPVQCPPDRLVMFWAGVPHQAVGVPQPTTDHGPFEQCNIYLPLDDFLYLPKLGALTETVMGGGIVALPADSTTPETLGRWYRDYRSGDT